MADKRRLVSDSILAVAAKTAEEMMLRDPVLANKWLDQNRTSAASAKAGGIIAMETDYDWIPAFFAWYHGAELPRS